MWIYKYRVVVYTSNVELETKLNTVQTLNAEVYKIIPSLLVDQTGVVVFRKAIQWIDDNTTLTG